MLKLKSYTRGLVGLKEQVSMSCAKDLRINSRSGIVVEGSILETFPTERITEYPFLNRFIALLYQTAPNLEMYVSESKDRKSIGLRDILIPDLTRDSSGTYANVVTLYVLTGGLSGPEARYHKRIAPFEELLRNALHKQHFRTLDDVHSRLEGLYVAGLDELLAYHFAVGTSEFLNGPSTLADLYENLSELIGFPIPDTVWEVATNGLSENECNWETIYAIGIWMLVCASGEYLEEAFEATLTTSLHLESVGIDSKLADVEMSLNVKAKLDALMDEPESREHAAKFAARKIFKNNQYL